MAAVERTVRYDRSPDEDEPEQLAEEDAGAEPTLRARSAATSTEDPVPFMGVKMRRRESAYRQYKGDYVDVASNPVLVNLLTKQGDREVLFADKVMRLTRRRRLVRRILMITDVAVYVLDSKFYQLKRRVPIPSIEKLSLSEQADNFFAIIVPSEYDSLLASTRKTEIVTVLVEASKKASPTEEPLEVQFSDKFEYYMDSEQVREVITEQVEGGVKTVFVDK